MIDMRQALSVERHFWSLQLKALQEVDEAVKPSGYWQEFVDRFLPQVRDLDLYDRRLFGGEHKPNELPSSVPSPLPIRAPSDTCWKIAK